MTAAVTSESSRPASCGLVSNDTHAAAETPIGLWQFQAEISAAKHDQVVWQSVELERLDIGERLCRREARNIRDRRMRLRATRSPVSTRVPPSFNLISMVFCAMKRPVPMTSSAPLAL
jgi:hypothetical protein